MIKKMKVMMEKLLHFLYHMRIANSYQTSYFKVIKHYQFFSGYHLNLNIDPKPLNPRLRWVVLIAS